MATFSSAKNFSVQTGATTDPNNHVLLMPKLKFRYRVIFTGMGSSGSKENDHILEMTRQVVTVDRPSVKFDAQKIHVYNSIINYVGKPSWGEIKVVVRDDVNGNASRVVAAQVQKQFDFAEQSAATSAGDYKFDMAIEMVDGANGSEGSQVLERWSCFGCIVTNVGYDSMDYSKSEPTQITITVQMDNCVQQLGTPHDPIGDNATNDAFPGIGSGNTETKTRVLATASSENMSTSAISDTTTGDTTTP